MFGRWEVFAMDVETNENKGVFVLRFSGIDDAGDMVRYLRVQKRRNDEKLVQIRNYNND